MSEYRKKIVLAGDDLGVFDPDEVTMEHAMMLEDKTGLTIVDLANGLGRLSARSMQALVWFQRIRKGDMAADLHSNFKIGDLTVVDEEQPDPTGAATAAELESLFAAGETKNSGS